MAESYNRDDGLEGDQNNSVGSDVATDLLLGTSIPAPIRKNLFKAFSRLCSAAIDLPLAHLQGKGDEKRAETEARIKLIHATAAHISEQMRVDPEYARRAATQFGNKVLREQVNLDMIAAQGIQELKSSGDPFDAMATDQDIDDDWLNNFETEARKKNTPEMQNHFARVLSEEIKKPNSFSIKSVKILGEMDKQSAEVFQKLCSMCLVLRDPHGSPLGAQVLSLEGNAANNALEKYGLGFGQLNFLNEHGLIISDYNSWRDYQFCIGQLIQVSGHSQRLIQIPFSYVEKSWVLTPSPQRSQTSQFRLHGVSLTRSGIELMKVVELESSETYTQDLLEFFRRQQLTMTEISEAIKITD